MGKKGFLGIDVSKGYADFLLLDSSCKVIDENFCLNDTKEGRNDLRKLIARWQLDGLEELYCGVESTGGYENNWYSYLKTFAPDSKVYVCRINPRGVKANGDADLKRTITDAVSAENIATYMIRFPHKVDYGINRPEADGGFKDGRQHLNCIKMQVKQKVQLSNQLEKLLYQNFAEILIYCRHGIPVWLLHMLVKYPSAASVIKAGATRISDIPFITKEKAKSIVAKAKKNQGGTSREMEHMIAVQAKEILHKDSLIKEEKLFLADLYKEAEEVKLLTTIPGIGIDSAIMIALEIEDVGRFETSKKMMSYFGVHPTFKQSGDGTWGNHMSKTGRGEIRAVMYMCALSGVRYNPVLTKLYARLREQGMKHYPAAGVVMHKLLRIIYGILKNKTQFCVATDVENQQKSAEKQKITEQQKKEKKKENKTKQHRYQTDNTKKDAPISWAKDKKIKKQVASQTS